MKIGKRAGIQMLMSGYMFYPEELAMKSRKITNKKIFITNAFFFLLLTLSLTPLTSCAEYADFLNDNVFDDCMNTQATPMFDEIQEDTATTTIPPYLLQRMVYAYGELFWMWVTLEEEQEVMTWLRSHPFNLPPSFLYREGYSIWDFGFVWEVPYANEAATYTLVYHEPSGRWRHAGPPALPPPPQKGLIRWGHDAEKWSYTDATGWIHTKIPEVERMAEFNYSMVFHGRIPAMSVDGIEGRICAHISNNRCPESCNRNHEKDIIYIDGNTYIHVYYDNISDIVVGLFRLPSGRAVYMRPVP